MGKDCRFILRSCYLSAKTPWKSSVIGYGTFPLFCESFTENGIQFVSGFVHLIVVNIERLTVDFIEIRIMIVYDPHSFLAPLKQQQQ